MMKTRYYWGLAAVVAGLGVALIVGCGRDRQPHGQVEAQSAESSATPVSVVTAETGSIEVAEMLTGSVEPLRVVDVQPEVAGKVIWVGPEVGQRVTRGQALVKLDTALVVAGKRQSTAAEKAAQARFGQSQVGLQLTSDQTASGVRQAEKALENARNRLTQAHTSAQLTRNRVEDSIKQAQLNVNSAQTRLADVKAGSRRQELVAAEARVEQARSVARLAKTNLQRVQQLLAGGAVAQAQLDAAQTEYETAQLGVKQAEQTLDLAREGARTDEVRLATLAVSQAEQTLAEITAQRGQIDVAEREVRAAELGVQQAEEALSLAKNQRRQVAAGEQEVAAARAAVQQARAATGYSQTQLSKHTIYAPISGVVAARNVEPGTGASPGMPVIQLVVLDPVRVVAEASDVQVQKLRVGQQAELTVDSFPGQMLRGSISDIAPAARDKQRLFSVRMNIANPGQLLRGGMFARVRIVTGFNNRAVLVPRETLVERGENRVVYLVAGNKIKVQTVKVGAAENGLVEIIKGVRAGDALVMGGQSLLGDGELVKPQPYDAAAAARERGDVTMPAADD
jgi:RND family efflux transporter MFP subunit